jgi:beta-galactosidase/beta-glucuronidase
MKGFVRRAVKLEVIEHDVRLMKQSNINSMPTSHYPDDLSSQAVSDPSGLYVC